MKFFLLAFFSLSVFNLALAAEEKVSCYKPQWPVSLKYSVVKVLSNNNQVTKVKILLANSDQTIEDQNPVASDRRLAPICHGTLSGRYLCTPWTTVTEYTKFENNLVTSLYFQSENTGKIEIAGESGEITLKSTSCF